MYKKLILTILILSIIDYFYLTFMKNYFNKQIKLVQNNDLELDMFAVLLCYILLIFGLYYFIIKDNKSIIEAFILGIVIYGVYELTNKGIFKNWNWMMVIYDGLWGGILFALTTYLVYILH